MHLGTQEQETWLCLATEQKQYEAKRRTRLHTTVWLEQNSTTDGGGASQNGYSSQMAMSGCRWEAGRVEDIMYSEGRMQQPSAEEAKGGTMFPP